MEKKSWKGLEGKFHDRARALSDELCACGCGNRITVRTAKARAKGTTKGYIDGHQRIGKTHSEASRMLMSLHKPDVYGEKNPNYGKGLFGSANPNWQGGKTDRYIGGNQPGIGTRQDLEFRLKIIERDKECVLCRSTNDLQVHHIEPWIDYVEKRFDEKNCVVLCIRCHKRADNKHHQQKYKLMLKGYIESL